MVRQGKYFNDAAAMECDENVEEGLVYVALLCRYILCACLALV